MLVAKRHKEITSVVNERGSIRVTELSLLFNVTEETIRRDLEKLESEGKLERTHGGAISIKDNQDEASYLEREVRNVKEKMAVAEEAIKYVKENDRIILDASTTAWYMAKKIPDIPLTVVTNSMKVAMELVNYERVSVITVGGTMHSKSLSFLGPLANYGLEFYHVNKAFISCQGIHVEKGISDSNEMQALVKKKMIDIADETYLLADYSKFAVQAFSRIVPMDDIDYIITDSKTNEEQLKAFYDLPLSLIRV